MAPLKPFGNVCGANWTVVITQNRNSILRLIISE